MFNRNIAITLLAALLFVSPAICQDEKEFDLKSNWDEFLHYTLVQNLEMAKGFAQAIMDNDPDPVQLYLFSQENPNGYQILLRASENEFDAELADYAKDILFLINRGAFIRRSDPTVIFEEVKRLSSTERARQTAIKRLRNAGEYAVPLMLDAMADPAREEEFVKIASALGQMSKDAIRPLAAALQTNNATVKSEIIKAMGEIKYPQSLPYLKYVLENEQSLDLRQAAQASINKIDQSASKVSAAELFYKLSENYYYHAASLNPAEDAPTANVWFWDEEQGKLNSEKVNKNYFNELMAMRTCEWALRANANYGSAIGLWIASFFKAESAGVGKMPEYFGTSHANALVYATTAGVEYLHQALARAVRDGNTYVALGVIDALGRTAGEKSLFYRLGTEQPLIQALSFKDRLVRYSAAIAIAAAGPKESFVESKLVVANLTEAIGVNAQTTVNDAEIWSEDIANSYATQAASVMLELAKTRNPVIDLSQAQNALINATNDDRNQIQILAGQTLAHLNSSAAQNAIAVMALDSINDMDVRVLAFNSLTASAKINANMLADEVISKIYELTRSETTDPNLRGAAAAAYGALNLPSRKVKDLILDQAKS